MPFNVDPSEVESVRVNRPDAPFGPERAPVSFVDQIWAAENVDNLAVNAARDVGLTGATQEPMIDDPEFDVYDHLADDEKMIGAEFAHANSVAELNHIRAQRAKETEWNRQYDEGPLHPVVAGLLAGLTDPTNYIGPSVLLKGGVRAVGKMAAVAGAETAAQEAYLQSVQQTRTAADSAAAVGAGALLTGVLATPIVALSKGLEFDPAALRRELADGIVTANSTAGAMRVPGALGPALDDPFFSNPEATKLMSMTGGIGSAVGRAVDSLPAKPRDALRRTQRALRKMGGVLRPASTELMTSKLTASRQLGMLLSDPGLLTRGHEAGMAAPAPLEVGMRTWDAAQAQSVQGLNQAFKSYRKFEKANPKRYSRHQFFEEVGNAIIDGGHGNEIVRQTADWVKTNIFGPVLQKYKAGKFLPKDIPDEEAMAYLTRTWKYDRINKARPEFRQRIVGWLDTQLNLSKSGKRKKGQSSPDQLGAIADNLIEQILESPAGRTTTGITIKGEVLSGRTFHMPTAMVREFVDTNIAEVMHRYIRSAAADIEAKRVFGDEPYEKVIENLYQKEQTELLSDPDLTEAQRGLIADQVRTDKELAVRLAQHILGDNARPNDPRMEVLHRVGAAGRTLNFQRLLGEMTLSALTDPAMMVMRHGLVRVFGTAIKDTMSGFKNVRLAKKDAQVAGTAWDWVLNQRAASVFDTYGHSLHQTRIEQAIDGGGRAFGIATGMTPWNVGMKSGASLLSSTRILDAAEAMAAGKKLSRADTLSAARVGLTPDLAKKFMAQREKWTEDQGLKVANVMDWDDEEAAMAYRRMMVMSVDDTILTPGRGDVPLWTNTEWGKCIFQFKRFMVASHTRIFQRGLQTHDMATMSGLVTMLGLGMMSQVLKDYSSKGEVKERTPEEWVIVALDRSGIVSKLFEVDSAFNKLTRGHGLQGQLVGQEASRFQGRDAIGQIMGPMFGFGTDAVEAVGRAIEGDFTQGDLHRVRTLVPWQNFVGLRRMFDAFEENLGEDLPERQGQ